jgi:uncharacterized protein YndB with AHSA1/START domain
MKSADTEMNDDELLIVRRFDAPASLVFALWSDAAHMRRWLGPVRYTCSDVEIDFRIGGAWRAVIVSPEGLENPMGGVYREIVPERRLVFTFAWDNDGPSAGVDMLVTITFEERDGQTVQTFHQTPFADAERRDNHIRGWTSSFDKLEACLATINEEHTT